MRFSLLVATAAATAAAPDFSLSQCRLARLIWTGCCVDLRGERPADRAQLLAKNRASGRMQRPAEVVPIPIQPRTSRVKFARSPRTDPRIIIIIIITDPQGDALPDQVG